MSTSRRSPLTARGPTATTSTRYPYCGARDFMNHHGSIHETARAPRATATMVKLAAGSGSRCILPPRHVLGLDEEPPRQLHVERRAELGAVVRVDARLARHELGALRRAGIDREVDVVPVQAEAVRGVSRRLDVGPVEDHSVAFLHPHDVGRVVGAQTVPFTVTVLPLRTIASLPCSVA